jgi:WD40 repeat protein
MKTTLHFLTTIIALFLLFFIPLQAQEEVPDTVWSKNLDNAQMVKYSPDEKFLYAGIMEIGRSLVYKLETEYGSIVDSFAYHPPLIKTIDLSMTGDTLLVSGSGFLWLWNVETGDTIYTLKYGSEACFTPDGKRIITTTGKIGDDEPQILIIDIATKEIIKTFIGRYKQSSQLGLSPDGKYFYFKDINGLKGFIFLMDLSTYEEITYFEYSTFGLSDPVISPDNKLLASISFEDGIIIWDIKSFKQLETIKYSDPNTKDFGLGGVGFSNDSKYVIFSYFDHEDYDPNEVIVWNINKDTLAHRYQFSGSYDLDISKDDYIAALGYTPYKLWHINLLRPKWNETSVEENEENDFKYILKDKILTIKFDDELNNTPTINIYDISGKLIKSISDFELQTDFKSINVNVDFLIPGVYLIEIITTKKHYSFKLMIP